MKDKERVTVDIHLRNKEGDRVYQAQSVDSAILLLRCIKLMRDLPANACEVIPLIPRSEKTLRSLSTIA